MIIGFEVPSSIRHATVVIRAVREGRGRVPTNVPSVGKITLVAHQLAGVVHLGAVNRGPSSERTCHRAHILLDACHLSAQKSDIIFGCESQLGRKRRRKTYFQSS